MGEWRNKGSVEVVLQEKKTCEVRIRNSEFGIYPSSVSLSLIHPNPHPPIHSPILSAIQEFTEICTTQIFIPISENRPIAEIDPRIIDYCESKAAEHPW